MGECGAVELTSESEWSGERQRGRPRSERGGERDHRLSRVTVVGAGLIGTSVALALRECGVDVLLSDSDDAALGFAEELGAGVRREGTAQPAELAVLAVPPGAVPDALAQAQREGVAPVYTDVSSVKAAPLARAAEAGCDLTAFVGGHPLAGRERSGPAAARSDLFLGRPWVLSPVEETSPAAVEVATALVRACGAEPVTLAPEAHDRAVALVSHAPHLVSTAVAARLLYADVDATALRLAGQGLRDTTRIAAGDPALWDSILSANPGPVADVLDDIMADLEDAAGSLRALNEAGTESREGGSPEDDGHVELLERGRDGRARLPGKRGGPAPDYTVVPVVIRDRPGELGRLFEAAGVAEVNIEDVALEHSPGLPVGVVELSVRPEQAATLAGRLRDGGWSVQGGG